MDCEAARATVRFSVVDQPAANEPTDEQIRETYLHLRRCGACRGQMNPEERARFVSSVVLGRE